MNETPPPGIEPLFNSRGRQRYRLTIRGDDPVVELRGYIDGWMELNPRSARDGVAQWNR